MHPDTQNAYLSLGDLTSLLSGAHPSQHEELTARLAKTFPLSPDLPHPVIVRNDPALSEAAKIMRCMGHTEKFTDTDYSERDIAETMRPIFDKHPQPALSQWSDLNRAVYASATLAHIDRGGLILRPTDALETLLAHTDMDASLPTSLFQPPHPALYVHFGSQWRQQIHGLMGPSLALSGARLDEIAIHGCYVIQSKHYCTSCQRNNRNIGLYLLVEYLSEPRHYQLVGGADKTLHDEDEPLTDTLVKKLDYSDSVPGGIFGEWPSVLVDLLAKLFLYMGSEGAQKATHTDYSQLQQRLQQVAAKKQAKLQQRLQRSYDWTDIGPATLSTGMEQSGDMAAHWRRGHLRQQAHGPQFSQRKVIFIAPTIVRADQLMPECQ